MEACSMTTSTSRLAYDDIFQLLERAFEDPKGVRVEFSDRDSENENRGEAIQFRIRIHTARQIDRADNRRLHPPEHPLHGRSCYDILRASIRTEEGRVFIYLEKRTLDGRNIENLSEGAGA